MQSIDPAAIAQQVVWMTFALGIAFGAVAQRTHFCTMGALTDIMHFGDWNRMRQWLLAMAVAIVGTTLLAFFDIIDLTKSLYTGTRLNWLSHVAGGACFGIGMVLASGCGNKTLVRIGSGNLKSLIVFIVLGLSAFMTLRGVLAVPRTALLDSQYVTLTTTQDLPTIVSKYVGSVHSMELFVGGSIALSLLAFVFSSRAFRARDVLANNLLAGIVVGCVIVAAWFVSGDIGHVTEHPDTLQDAYIATNSGRMESFSFVAPFAYTLDLLMMWTDTSKAVTFGIAATLGVIAGSFIMAIAGGAFRWEGFGNVEDVANHLTGGALMGFGGVTALGCTIGQGLSGISTLSVGSLLTVAGIMGGGVLATRYQRYRIAS
jgi:uncharacterized membrane protein YedE/YeeE